MGHILPHGPGKHGVGADAPVRMSSSRWRRNFTTPAEGVVVHREGRGGVELRLTVDTRRRSSEHLIASARSLRFDRRGIDATTKVTPPIESKSSRRSHCPQTGHTSSSRSHVVHSLGECSCIAFQNSRARQEGHRMVAAAQIQPLFIIATLKMISQP
jgi:hypothetical protein